MNTACRRESEPGMVIASVIADCGEVRDKSLGGCPSAFAQQVLQQIYVDESGTIASIQQVSDQFNMSQHTVRRRLKVAGTSYSELKAHYRFERAKHYLTSSTHSMAEISILLAYKEADNFYKSFKQWTGQTPGQYRREYQ